MAWKTLQRVKTPPTRNNPEKEQPIHQQSTLRFLRKTTQETREESTELHKVKERATMKRRGEKKRKPWHRASKNTKLRKRMEKHCHEKKTMTQGVKASGREELAQRM